MALDAETRDRIASLIESNDVVLFMKGTRETPQCGFSAATVQVLDTLLADYTTVDVLADPTVRQGIKDYSSWPTIPQLYVRGEFIGGSDIVRELYASHELHEKLGVEVPESPEPPNVTIMPTAVEAIRNASANAPEPHLHLRIDARFDHSLYLGPVEPGDVEVESNGVKLFLDPASAHRAEGVVLDVGQSDTGPAFKIHNPNAPKTDGAPS